MRGRSACNQCAQPIAAYDLIPVISYFVLNGRCRKCGVSFGRASLVTELATALVGAVPLLILPTTQAIAATIFGWMLLPLIILDFKHLWLPDNLVIALAGMGLFAGSVLTPEVTTLDRLIAVSAAFASLEVIRRGYKVLRGNEGMGAGDPKLFGAVGLWLGWQALPVTLLAASAVGIAAIIVKRDTAGGRHAAVPFGSYLGVAAYCIALTR